MTILSALAKAYERIPDAPAPGYSLERIGFVISLNKDGTVAAVAPRGDADVKLKSAPPMLVPQPAKKSVNISPNFLWGNTAYVLGVTAAEGKKPTRLASEHAAFVRYHMDCLKDATDDGLLALRRFLEAWSPERFIGSTWPDDLKDQNLVFALEEDRRHNVYLHGREEAKSLWARMRADGDTGQATCLVTGAVAPFARLHPSIKGVWGAQTSGASIVAFNQESFESYGHEQGENAPVSEDVVFRYTTALNTFLGRDSKNRIQIGDASTVYWAEAADGDVATLAEKAFGGMYVAPDQEIEDRKVGDILARIRRGEPLKTIAPELAEGVRFYVLGLSPNAARLSIRFWFENDFGVLARNYQRFVQDIVIEPPPRDGRPVLWKYLSATAVLGKRENVPPNLAGEWMRSILTGAPYPLTLLATVLMRIRADKDVDALRVGMLKAVLVRNFKAKETPVAIDTSNTNRGYLLGRLFATYEHAQTAALGRNVNATIKDKYYGAASAQPRKVFPILDRGVANHLSKVGKVRPGQKTNLERAIGQIFEQMSPADDPFPASLAAQEQALFALGYYHQRNDFFRKPGTADTGESAQ